jgi:hypothetical protein
MDNVSKKFLFYLQFLEMFFLFQHLTFLQFFWQFGVHSKMSGKKYNFALQIDNNKYMLTKEQFIEKMGALWEELAIIEQSSTDLYEFETKFEKTIDNFGQEALKNILGSEKRDRREKKNSKPDTEQ